MIAMDIIFWIMLGLIGLVLLIILFVMFWQFLFIIFAPIKPKHFKKSTNYKKFAIIIPAHNEEVVIGDTVKYLLNKLDYPKDLYDVYVCADNCTDNTFKLAKENGAVTFERHEDDPKKKRASFPIKLLVDEVLKTKKYDAVIKMDADNIPCEGFLKAMNDALNEGVEIARSHEAPSNMGQNVWTATASVYYARDSRLASNFRERVGWNSMLSGAGMMVTTKVLEEIGGWDAMGTIDDAEFCVKRLLERRKVHYVADAVIYEDQPSSLADSASRNARMSNGLTKLYWEHGWKLVGMFFKTGKLSYLDMFSQLTFVQIPLLIGITFPIYLAFFFITLGLQAGGIPVYTFLTPGVTGSAFWTMMSVIFAGVGFLLFYYIVWTYQCFMAVYLDREYLGKSWYKDAKKGIWLSAFTMVAYGSSVREGSAKKEVTWKSLKRNKPNNK